MLRLLLKMPASARTDTRYGSAAELVRHLHDLCPESRPYHDLDDAVQAVNEYGEHEAEAGPYAPSLESNQLPEDYLTHEEQDPREDR